MITMELQKKYPAFMKPFFEDCSNPLQIHPTFTSFMKSSMPDKAFLRNCDGKIWTVEVTKLGVHFYFQEGWRRFIKENHIEFGDLLVFHYNGEYVFDFKILGKKASEKEVLEAFDFNRQDEEEAAEEMLNETTPKKKNEPSGAGSTAMTKNLASKDIETQNMDDDNPSKTGYINGNPYFVTKITENSEGILYVPSEMIYDNGIKLGGVITLLDPCGRVWCSKVSKLRDGRIKLHGWNRFCKRSNLHVGDECVCEIVGEKDGKATYIQILSVKHCISLSRNSGDVEKLGKLDTRNFEIYMENLWKLISEEKRNMFAYFDSLWFFAYSKGIFKERVLSWIKSKNIFSKKYVIVPIVQWGHWNLLILCDFGERPWMLLLDSMKTAHSSQVEPQVRRFVFDIFKVEERPENEELVRKIPLIIPNVPQQKGGEECGYFVLYYIKLFLESASENFSFSIGSADHLMKEDWFTDKKVECFVRVLGSMKESS